jgi:hypothetical protein
MALIPMLLAINKLSSPGSSILHPHLRWRRSHPDEWDGWLLDAGSSHSKEWNFTGRIDPHWKGAGTVYSSNRKCSSLSPSTS